MREIHIDLSSDYYLQQVKTFGGYAGEHNESKLVVKLPNRMISDDIDYYYFEFQTALGEHITSPNVYKNTLSADNAISIVLWEQLSPASGNLKFCINAIELGEDDTITIKGKTPVCTLYILESPTGENVLIDPKSSKEELQKSIDSALKEAKDSGEFKGDKGDKGEKGDTGAQGLKGDKGDKGTDGYTPKKGVDYFTDEDIASLNIPSVDQTYAPTSENAQSGKAVKEAVAIEQKRSDNTFSNALRGSKTDTAILIDDVSPITHEMSVKISSDTVEDLTAVRLIKKNGSGKVVADYTPNSDGTVNGVTSLYPNTTLMTDTDGVIIDCEYNKDINIVLKHININTWKDIQDTVRAGFGHIRFPVGYEFTTRDSVTGADIIWVVEGHNHHKASNSKLKHSMTLEAKYVYSNSAGTYLTLAFDAYEALYYAAEEIPAGTYNFTWNYATGNMINGTYQFTLTKAVPAGGQIVLSTNSNSMAITGRKIATYATVAATAAIESDIVVTEGSEGTSLGTIAATSATSENLNCAQRIIWGSNNYAQSAVRQWLNSDTAAGSVWTPTNKFDRAPSWAASESGFMKGLPADFLAAVQPAVIPCRTNSVFEVNSLDGTEYTVNTVYSLNDMFFMLSRPEIYGSWDSTTYQDGKLLEFYEGFTDIERIKYDAAGSARNCWLRSPNPGYASTERSVGSSGTLFGNYTIYAHGVAPACIIA